MNIYLESKYLQSTDNKLKDMERPHNLFLKYLDGC